MLPPAGSRFKTSATVHVRREVPGGNPRTPADVRGNDGVAAAVHGAIPNPLEHRGLYPPLYTVVFQISELFPGRGDGKLHVDTHEDCLESAAASTR